MIIIYIKDDLKPSARGKLAADVTQSDVDIDKQPPAGWAEDVYFWRDGEATALKRRNHPLTVPDWLKELEGVDQ